jgi:hypothetical protein
MNVRTCSLALSTHIGSKYSNDFFRNGSVFSIFFPALKLRRAVSLWQLDYVESEDGL